MNETISKNSLTGSNLLNELIETIQSDIKFFKEAEDGSFSLEKKSVPEILSILRKREEAF